MRGVISVGVYPKACVSYVAVYSKASVRRVGLLVCRCVSEGFC